MSNEKLLRREADPDMSVVGSSTDLGPPVQHVRSTLRDMVGHFPTAGLSRR